MSAGQIALLISFGSMLVAATSLGWNIYRDVIRKPKLRVTLIVGAIVYSSKDHSNRVVITITNFGPGKSQANMLQLRKSSLWRRILRKELYAVLIHDYEDSLSGRLPTVLDVGDKVDLTFRFAPDLFLMQDFTHVGISDPFGRVYWCKRSNYREAQRNYRKLPDTTRRA
jgi:hypothetical protein